MSTSGTSGTMLYDGDSNRVAKSANSVVTRYLADDLNPTGLQQVMDELNAGGVVTRDINQPEVVPDSTWGFFAQGGFSPTIEPTERRNGWACGRPYSESDSRVRSS